jgi:chromosome partitioning protein
MTTIVLGARKGGCAKTTTACYLGSLLAQDGKTVIIDADPSGGSMSWSIEAGPGFPPTIAWPTRDLAKRVQDIQADWKHIILDTGRAAGTGDDPILRNALMVADLLIIPTGAAVLDVREIGKVLDLVTDLAPLRHVDVRVLLTRVRAGTNSLKEAREGLASAGLQLMRSQVVLRESYAASYGSVISNAQEYNFVLEELRTEGLVK